MLFKRLTRHGIRPTAKSLILKAGAGDQEVSTAMNAYSEATSLTRWTK